MNKLNKKDIILIITFGIIAVMIIAIILGLNNAVDQKQEYNNVVIQYAGNDKYTVIIQETQEKFKISKDDIHVIYTTDYSKVIFNTFVKETTKLGTTRYKLYLEVNIF